VELLPLIAALLNRNHARPRHSFTASATTTICIFLTDLVDLHAAVAEKSPDKSPCALIESWKLRALAKQEQAVPLMEPDIILQLLEARGATVSTQVALELLGVIQAVGAAMVQQAALSYATYGYVSEDSDAFDDGFSSDESDMDKGTIEADPDKEVTMTVAHIVGCRRHEQLRPIYMRTLLQSGLFLSPSVRPKHAVAVRRRWPLAFVVQVLKDEWSRDITDSELGTDTVMTRSSKKDSNSQACWGGLSCSVQ